MQKSNNHTRFSWYLLIYLEEKIQQDDVFLVYIVQITILFILNYHLEIWKLQQKLQNTSADFATDLEAWYICIPELWRECCNMQYLLYSLPFLSKVDPRVQEDL